MTTDLSDEELSTRYEQLYTGLITDVLDDYGYHDQTLDTEIKPIASEMTMAGVAFPAVGKANRQVDPEAQMRRFLTMLGDVPAHSVLIVDANSDDASQIGELTTTALAAQDCRGAVIDGGTRDTGFILDQEFPVFTRYLTPSDSIQRWELLDYDVSTVIGGVEVSPGDVVVGDIDGVAIVPHAIAEDVLNTAEEMLDAENAVRSAIRDGDTPLEAYEKHGTF